jgi:hypothetical protein
VLAVSIISHHPDNEAASTPEMPVNLYQTTWCNNPEDSHLHIINKAGDFSNEHLEIGFVPVTLIYI